MRHPLDRSVGSDRSYEVFKFNREHPEFLAAARDAAHQRLGPVRARVDAIAADRVVGVSEIEWDARQRQMRLA